VSELGMCWFECESVNTANITLCRPIHETSGSLDPMTPACYRAKPHSLPKHRLDRSSSTSFMPRLVCTEPDGVDITSLIYMHDRSALQNYEYKHISLAILTTKRVYGNAPPLNPSCAFYCTCRANFASPILVPHSSSRCT